MNIRIRENSWLAAIAAKNLGVKKVAIVLGNTIHLHQTRRGEFLSDISWVNHELIHIAQFRKYGFLTFIVLYLWESMKHGYINNKYEKEARMAEIADKHPPHIRFN
jgi:hypothetical protein